ncbi:MAG: hypothetical protein OEY52_02420 [Gammaproteobacteria bacterium]|nr:hypothetical protein [Gammaproteobacteria bacterium]
MNKTITPIFLTLLTFDIGAEELDKRNCISQIEKTYGHIEQQIHRINSRFEKLVISSGVEAKLHKYYESAGDTQALCYFDKTIRKNSKIFLQGINNKRISEINHIRSQKKFDTAACSKHIKYLEKEAQQLPARWENSWQKVISKANKNLLFYSTMESAEKMHKNH